MSLAAPWPLKLVLDNALGNHHLPAWLDWAHQMGIGRHTLGVALFAGLATLVIARHRRASPTYIDNYYTESVGQWVANDLRMRIYEHLHRLSLGYYDTRADRHADVDDHQRRRDGAELRLVVDARHPRRHRDDRRHAGADVLARLGLRADRGRRDAVPAAVRDALQEGGEEGRRARCAQRQSEIVAVVQQGLGSVRAVKAFGRQDLEVARMDDGEPARPSRPRCKARRIKSLLSPVVAVVVALCTAIVLWRGTALILAGTMTVGALTVFLAYLSKFFKPVQDLAKMTNTIAQTTVALERIQKILGADDIIPEQPGRQRAAAASRARSRSSTSPSATTTTRRC